ncbi:MAG: hypothetical protein ABSB89_10770 [Candidatus Bathyarchaeia archaeon]
MTTAIMVEEAKQALSVGFKYITEKDGIMLFRRPKRFWGINAGLGV